MLQTYSTANDEILFIADPLTDVAYTWYSGNENQRYPNPQSGYLAWDIYTRFKREFMTPHQNPHESRENEFSRKGNPMLNLMPQVMVLQLVANLTKQ